MFNPFENNIWNLLRQQTIKQKAINDNKSEMKLPQLTDMEREETILKTAEDRWDLKQKIAETLSKESGIRKEDLLNAYDKRDEEINLGKIVERNAELEKKRAILLEQENKIKIEAMKRSNFVIICNY